MHDSLKCWAAAAGKWLFAARRLLVVNRAEFLAPNVLKLAKGGNDGKVEMFVCLLCPSRLFVCRRECGDLLNDVRGEHFR